MSSLIGPVGALLTLQAKAFAAPAAATVVKDPSLIYPICSSLSFDGVTFPTGIGNAERTGFELGLNISGSFEGNDGWANLSNDFDGMGLSLGLLNQNLGSGSLQPLLIQMATQYPSVLKSIFTPAQYQSLTAMLAKYQNLVPPGPARVVARRGLLSPKDSYGETPDISVLGPQSLTPEEQSVEWATSTLYADPSASDFKTEWQNALKTLAAHPDYVTIQVGAAHAIDEQAWKLMNTIQVYEVRSYLLMFDFVVQDGGIYESDLANYQAQVRKNPKWTDTNKLLAIANLRLAHIGKQWLGAVRARKLAIINGSGIVNQTPRNLQKQYCYTGKHSL
jgi:hypothetical protein